MNKAPAAYALCTSAKLAVGTTTPSLCKRTDDADIWHFIHRYFCNAVLDISGFFGIPIGGCQFNKIPGSFGKISALSVGSHNIPCGMGGEGKAGKAFVRFLEIMSRYQTAAEAAADHGQDCGVAGSLKQHIRKKTGLGE